MYHKYYFSLSYWIKSIYSWYIFKMYHELKHMKEAFLVWCRSRIIPSLMYSEMGFLGSNWIIGMLCLLYGWSTDDLLATHAGRSGDGWKKCVIVSVPRGEDIPFFPCLSLLFGSHKIKSFSLPHSPTMPYPSWATQSLKDWNCESVYTSPFLKWRCWVFCYGDRKLPTIFTDQIWAN